MSTVFTWKLTIEYEGTRYYGWQEQKQSRTVAGEIRRAAESYLACPVELLGAGRTDAGVHALAQVARLRASKRAKEIDLLRAINDGLPPDINILKVDEAPPRFDPRRDPKARYYLYQVALRRTAFAKRFAWWVRDRLDAEKMREASRCLRGRHDFARFCERREDEQSTVVVVERVETRVEGDLFLFRIGASHFLWKMVRRIAGTLVGVGRGAISIAEFASLIDGASVKGRTPAFDVAANTAPPSGLFLERVVYDERDQPGALVSPFPVRRL